MSCVEKTPKTNLEIRLELRNKLNTVVKNKPISIKIEIGIYNFTINQADNCGITKREDNNKFKKLYVNKTMSVYVNLQSNSYIKNDKIATATKRKRI